MISFITINGLDFNLFVRGVLVVGVGVGVLMGSVYLLLATNSGGRTGLFIALTAFFGWMAIMGTIWWIYGIGLQGRLPSWKVTEMNRGDLAAAQFDKARELADGLSQTLGEPMTRQGQQVVDIFAKAEEEQKPPKVAGWTGMLASNRSRGEAQAAVDAFLISDKVLDSGSYVPVGAFVIGGKDPRPAGMRCNLPRPKTWGTCLDRAGMKLHSVFVQPFHPAKYAAVMVQPATQKSLVVRPGEAPPLKQLDADQPIYTVLMERDLGSKRLPPAMVTFGSVILFLTFAWRLHERDRAETAARGGGALVPAGKR